MDTNDTESEISESEISKKSDKIHFVIPLKNRGKHVSHLLTNIQKVVDETKETNIKVWIGDFHSTDIDLVEFVKQFTYSIEIVWFDGIFIIGKALQGTAEKITNPNDIIYFLDADTVVPNTICQRIREFTIKNEQVYIPMVSRQLRNKKIQHPYPPHGHGGKGNVGVYNEDFIKSGGWAIGFHHQNKNKGGDPMRRRQWGMHDDHIWHLLEYGMGLKVWRPREKDQWIRYHRPRLGWGK